MKINEIFEIMKAFEGMYKIIENDNFKDLLTLSDKVKCSNVKKFHEEFYDYFRNKIDNIRLLEVVDGNITRCYLFDIDTLETFEKDLVTYYMFIECESKTLYKTQVNNSNKKMVKIRSYLDTLAYLKNENYDVEKIFRRF